MIGTNTTRRIVKLEEQGSQSAHVAFNFEDIRVKCDAFIEQTRHKASQMLIEAHEAGEKLKAAAIQQGLKDGEKQGLASAELKINQQAEQLAEQKLKASLETLKPALEQAADLMRSELQAVLSNWEHQLISLSSQLAGRIVRQRLTVDPLLAIEMVREVLQATLGEDRIQVQLHPDDLELVKTHMNLDQQTSAQTLPITLIPAEHFVRGDCIVNTAHGQIDARIESMLDQLCGELTGANS